MAMTADERDELHALLQRQLGPRGADLLMAGMAAADLEAMEERLTLRIELSRAETHAELGELRGQYHELRGEIGAFRGEVGAEIGRVRSEIGAVKADIGEFRGEVGQEFGKVRAEMAAQNRIMVFATITAGIGVVSIVLGLAGLVVTAVQLAGA